MLHMRLTVLAFFVAGIVLGIGVPRMKQAFTSPAVTPQQQAEIARDWASIYSDAAQHSPVKVTCPKADRVIVVVGQSNGANNVAAPQVAAPMRVVNFYDGHCYAARDPLLGATGDRAAVWTRLAAQLPGVTVLAPVAVGASVMEEWAPGGRLHARYELVAQQLRAAGYEPTDILVVEGESDGIANADPRRFEAHATALLRSLTASGARVYVALTSRCIGYKPNEAIRAGLRRAVVATGARLGPDLDVIPDAARTNGCHFNQAGLAALADGWQKTLTERP